MNYQFWKYVGGLFRVTCKVANGQIAVQALLKTVEQGPQIT